MPGSDRFPSKKLPSQGVDQLAESGRRRLVYLLDSSDVNLLPKHPEAPRLG